MKRATVLAALFCVSVMVATSLVCIADCGTTDSVSDAYDDGCEENKTTFWEGMLQYIVNGDGKSVRVNNFHGNGVRIVVPSEVTHGGKTYTVTEITCSAFSQEPFFIGDTRTPSSVEIGPEVTCIGFQAFRVTNKEGFTFTIRDIEHSQLRKIEAQAFQFSAIKKIELPASIETIGDCAFQECYGLEEVILPDGPPTHGLDICDRAFVDCHNLKTFNFSKVTGIGKRAFEGCYALRDLDLSHVGNIYKEAFKGVRNIEHITFDENLKHVAGNVFTLKFFDIDGKEFKFGDQNLGKLRGKTFVRADDGCMHEVQG